MLQSRLRTQTNLNGSRAPTSSRHGARHLKSLLEVSKEPTKSYNIGGSFMDSSKRQCFPASCTVIAVHTGRGGHRGIEPTKLLLRKHFFWTRMAANAESFVKSCLHCLCTDTDSVVPRPLKHSVHAGHPKQILHFYYCFIGKGDKGFSSVLIWQDYFSFYVCFFPFVAADANSAVEALME